MGRLEPITIEHDKAVEKLEAYQRLPWFLRLDVLPFCAVYFICHWQIWNQSADSGIGHPVFFILPVVLSLHLLVFLFCRWRVSAKVSVGFRRARTLADTHWVRVIPFPNHGTETVVPMVADFVPNEELPLKVAGRPFPRARLRFTFEAARFCYYGQPGGAAAAAAARDESKQALFQRLSYPTDGKVADYLSAKGYGDQALLVTAVRRWGLNSLEIPVPPFLDLFKEHLVAPFFVFQVVCVLLWMLDEYWYYSLFTLAMLLVFEAAVCKQRQAAVQFVRGLRRAPHALLVHRLGGWRPTSSLEVLPGEVISLRSMPEQEDALVPVDALLLGGTAVVNEAMLTGESVPQVKTAEAAVAAAAEGERLRPAALEAGAAKRAVVFAGTTVLQHTPPAPDELAKGGVPLPPDGGCPAFVLRTGFETAQGNLMRTILFSQKKMVVGDRDTGKFILVLVLCALAAAAHVLRAGLADPRRSKFKLALHCIMVVTTVVPPELPMELSMAVSNSLNALMRQLIYCTEPHRIPFAGKVDVCAFDKTGTLTSDELRLLGVVAPGEGLALAAAAAAPAGGAAAAADEDGGEEEEEEEDGEGEAGLTPPGEVEGDALKVLIGCHGLTLVPGTGLVGDPMEKAALTGIGYTVRADGVAAPAAPGGAAAEGEGATLVVDAAGELLGGGAAAAAIAEDAAAAAAAPPSAPEDPDRPTATDAFVVDMGAGQVLRAWAFASDARRMTTVAAVGGGGGNGNGGGGNGGARRHYVLVKGAPEKVAELLGPAAVPGCYAAAFQRQMGRGRRVLALALRPVGAGEDWRRAPRAALEAGLRFAGLLALSCPLKYDTAQVMADLRASAHRVVMITGDAAPTAADVGRRLRLLRRPPARTLVLDAAGAEELGPGPAPRGAREWPRALRWRPLLGGGGGGAEGEGEGAGGGARPFSPGAATAALAAEGWDLCATGAAVGAVVGAFWPPEEGEAGAGRKDVGDSEPVATGPALAALATVAPHVAVFARMAPAQKEAVIGALNLGGRTTLMCGDGTNDVGALRRAHVGLSLLNCPGLERRLKKGLGGGSGKKRRKKEKKTPTKVAEISLNDSTETGIRRRKGSKAEETGSAVGAATEEKKQKKKKEKAGTKKKTKKSKPKPGAMMKLLAEIQEQEQAPGAARLGDASVASPFTAKRVSCDAALALIRQGRCTLVTTLQMYKILALNCLVGAYLLSALYAYGVKQGDTQMVVAGVLVALLFFAVSRAKPLERVSAERPPAGVFCPEVVASVVVQFAAHLACLVLAVRLCAAHLPDVEDPFMVPDGPFYPNPLSSVVYLLSTLVQANNFAANYAGHPFMEGLRENKLLFWSLTAAYGALAVAATEAFEPLQDLLQLAPMPSPAFRNQVLALLAADTVLAVGGEKIVRLFFSKQKKIAVVAA